MPTRDAPKPIVVCPLAFEQHWLRRAGCGRRCLLDCSGPGAPAIARWAATRRPGGPVILCGLAGSLSDAWLVGSAHVPIAVAADDGGRYAPTFGALRGDAGGAPLFSSAPTTLTTSQARRSWAERSGADIVDLESVAFARAATAARWRWTIVRGISDGPATSLPPDIDDWVSERGRARPGMVVRALARRRVTIGQLRRLRSDSVAAMQAAARLIEQLLDEIL